MSTGAVFANELSERFYKALNQKDIGIYCLPSSFKFPAIHEKAIIDYMSNVVNSMPFLKDMGINENTYAEIFNNVSNTVINKYITEYENYARTQLMKTRDMLKNAFMKWYEEIMAISPGLSLGELASKFEQQYDNFATEYKNKFIELCEQSINTSIDPIKEFIKEIDRVIETRKTEYIQQFEFYLIPLIKKQVDERVKVISNEYEHRIRALETLVKNTLSASVSNDNNTSTPKNNKPNQAELKKKIAENRQNADTKYKLLLCVDYDAKNIIETNIMLTRNDVISKYYDDIKRLVPNCILIEFKPNYYLIDDINTTITIRVLTNKYNHEPWKISFNTNEITNLHYDVKYALKDMTTVSHKSILSPLTSAASVVGDTFLEYPVSYDGIFENCTKLVCIDKPKYDTSNVISFANVFKGCSSLKTIDISNLRTNKVNSIAGLCKNCSFLTNFKSGKLSNASNYDSAFENCQNLVSIDVNKWEPMEGTTFKNMITGCKNLLTFEAKQWNAYFIDMVKNSSTNYNNVF